MCKIGVQRGQYTVGAGKQRKVIPTEMYMQFIYFRGKYFSQCEADLLFEIY